MAYSLGSGSYVISLCLLVAIFIQVTWVTSMLHGGCSGKVKIHLKTYHILNGLLDYNGQCCDGTVAGKTQCKPCDPFIVACLLDLRDHGHRSCVSANLSTVPVNNTNDIDFETTPGLVADYFTFNFTIPSNKLLLQFSMYDDDKYDTPPTEPDLLEKSAYTIYTLTPLKFTDTLTYRNGTMPTNKTSLEFDYYFQCDQYFYGNCDKYCHPDPDKYNCSSDGSRVCNSGWISPNCTTFDYCSNVTCLNGGSCSNESNTFKCICAKNFTGALCEHNATTNSSPTAQGSPVPTPQTSSSTTPQTSNSIIAQTSNSTTLQTSTPTPKKDHIKTSNQSPTNRTRPSQKTKLSQSKEEEKGDNTGAIVGAVIGTLVALGLVAAGVAYYIKRQKNKIHTRSELQPDNETKTDPGADETRIEHEPDSKATDQTKIKPDNVDSQQNGQLSQHQNEIEINNRDVTKD